MNNIIDIALMTAKLATIKDEKARMMVGGVSVVYNVAQISRFRSMIVELSQICFMIDYKAKIRGKYTDEEYKLIQECKREIEICNQEIEKYGVMTVMEGISLLVDAFTNINKK